MAESSPTPTHVRRSLRLLLVEDSEVDAELLLHDLSRSYDVSARRVYTAADMRVALESESWDIVVSDYNMPSFTAPDALNVLRETDRDIPFIIVSGTIGEDTAVASLKAGACDFLVKGKLARLAPAIERELRESEMRRERERAHQALEEQLRQAQKMEAIGQLAGGVAHDFNNMLTAILGYAQLLNDQIGPDKPIGRDLQQIVLAAERAAALTRQLLAFGRKQNIKPVALSLNRIVEHLEPMLRRLITANIRIRTSLDQRVASVMADATQLEQVLMNLAVNGRDAMPNGGTLTIETRNATLAEEAARHHNGSPSGACAVLSVADTGMGMSRDVMSRIFEPFFTTKELGRGTGLGLAAVYGIVKQLGGHISVDSEPGVGSTFKIFLPATDQPAEDGERRLDAPPPIGREAILIVEDEPSVRAFARDVLARHGYQVIEADSSEAALARIDEERRRIDLLVTDLMLSGLNGGQLATRLRTAQPSLRILFMTGYADPGIGGDLPADVELLEKPFTARRLLTCVRRALEG